MYSIEIQNNFERNFFNEEQIQIGYNIFLDTTKPIEEQIKIDLRIITEKYLFEYRTEEILMKIMYDFKNCFENYKFNGKIKDFSIEIRNMDYYRYINITFLEYDNLKRKQLNISF